MDITDENNEERRTSFKKITQEEEEEEDEKESLYWGWRGKTGRRTKWRRGSGFKPATNLTDGVSQFPPGTTFLPGRKKDRERMKSVPLL